MIEDKQDYYAGLILHALILKENYLATSSIWGEPFTSSTKRMCRVAAIVSREMVKAQEQQGEEEGSRENTVS
ncbi:MAG: hypothetical protein K9M94_14720 [Spirochaetia bacterium]|nr:hypothetical protein [Spirochaetia bacterium]